MDIIIERVVSAVRSSLEKRDADLRGKMIQVNVVVDEKGEIEYGKALLGIPHSRSRIITDRRANLNQLKARSGIKPQ